MKFFMRLYKRKNGYWYYETRRNRPVSLQTKNKREAQQLYAIIQKEVLRQRLVMLDSDKRATVSEFRDIFFLRHADIGGKARDAYDLAMRLFMDTTGETSLIGRIGEEDILRFKSVCLARGCRKTTVNNYLRHLRTIFNKALSWGYITSTPKLDFYRIPKTQPRTLTKTEQKALLSKASKTDPEMARIIEFALWTGCRRAEIAGLRWQDIQNNMAKIVGKGGKERTIPLLPKAIKAMGTPRDIGPVFIQFKDLSKYTKAFKSLARSAGIDDIHFHNLRHTAATQMIESGIEIRYVQEMLGHSSVTTTEIYTKIVQKTLRRKIKKLRY